MTMVSLSLIAAINIKMKQTVLRKHQDLKNECNISMKRGEKALTRDLTSAIGLGEVPSTLAPRFGQR